MRRGAEQKCSAAAGRCEEEYETDRGRRRRRGRRWCWNASNRGSSCASLPGYRALSRLPSPSPCRTGVELRRCCDPISSDVKRNAKVKPACSEIDFGLDSQTDELRTTNDERRATSDERRRTTCERRLQSAMRKYGLKMQMQRRCDATSIRPDSPPDSPATASPVPLAPRMMTLGQIRRPSCRR